MHLKKVRAKKKPETIEANKFVRYCQAKGWLVIKLHGSMYQAGLPDYVMFHYTWGTRWVEFKTITGKLEHSQIARFTQMHKAGVGVYVIKSVDEYEKLFKPANFGEYLNLQVLNNKGVK